MNKWFFSPCVYIHCQNIWDWTPGAFASFLGSGILLISHTVDPINSICYSQNPHTAKFKENKVGNGVRFTSCFIHPLGGAPLKLSAFKEGGILDLPLPPLTKDSGRFQSVRTHCGFYLTGTFPMSLHFIQALTAAGMALFPIIGFPGIDPHSRGFQSNVTKDHHKSFIPPPSLSISLYI